MENAGVDADRAVRPHGGDGIRRGACGKFRGTTRCCRALERRLRVGTRRAARGHRLSRVQHEARRGGAPPPESRCCTTSRRRSGRGAPDGCAKLARIVTRGGGDPAVRGTAASSARHRRDVRRASAARPRERDAGSRGSATSAWSRRRRRGARTVSRKPAAGDRSPSRRLRSDGDRSSRRSVQACE